MDNDELDNDTLNSHMDEFENGFDFHLTPHVDRRVRKFGLHHRNYTARLMQRGGGVPLGQPRGILVQQLEEALHRAISTQVLSDANVRSDDHLLININSNRLKNSYHSKRLRVKDWLENTLAAQTMLQQLSKMLNSNEQFQLDDSFNLNISHIKNPVGRGRKICYRHHVEKKEISDHR